MGTGPIPSTKLALKRAGLNIGDLDIIESNEAFAVQALCVNKGLDLDPAKVNVHGGAIALGHALAATGTVLTVKCLYELQRIKRRYGLVTMCIGGGQGISAIFERA
jgi:acetyl-CoA C-acetyltransferase